MKKFYKIQNYNLLLISLLILIVLISATSCSKENEYDFANMETRHVEAFRKLRIKDITELAEVSDIIVRAKVLDGRENSLVYSEKTGHVIIGYNITNIKIKDILKGEEDRNIISLAEEYWITTSRNGKEIFNTFEGYEPLETNKEYILYLIRINRDVSAGDINYKDKYFIVDLDTGKYPYIKDYNEETVDGLTRDDLSIGKETKETKYKQEYKYILDECKKLKEEKDNKDK